MPVEAKDPKALYIAKSMSQLNEKVDLKMDKGTSVKVYCSTAAKMFKAAKDAYLQKDEERAYVLYMKFANLTQQIRKTKGYNNDKDYYNSMMGANNIMGAVEKAEVLSKSLSDRYSELKEAEEIKARLDQRDKEEEEAKHKAKDGAVVNGINGDASEAEPDKEIGQDGCITSEELYRLFQDKNRSVLVLDARSTEQFEASHMKCDKCANIPDSAIKPGCTVAIIEKGLSSSAKTLFHQRGQVDYIVMMDWESTLEDLTPRSTLSSLKDAIYKWDSTVTLKHEPLVLNGGYDRWLLKYPMYSTDPKVIKPDKAITVNKYASLDFDYPTSLEDEEPEKPPEPKSSPAPDGQRQQNGPLATATAAAGTAVGGAAVAAAKPTPMINRALKPGAAKPAMQVSMPSPNSSTIPARVDGTTRQVLPSTNGAAASPAASYPKTPALTGTGDAKPAGAGMAAAAARPTIPDRVIKPEAKKVTPAEDAKSQDLPPPSYEDVQESDKEDVAQQELMQEHKNKENEARLELERMRQRKTKAENEQLKKEKEDVERKLEEKIAALQTLQKQLQEQQAKQEEEKKQAEEKAKAEEERRKAQEQAKESSSESAATGAAGSIEASKPQPTTTAAAAAPAKPSPSKDATKPKSDTAQSQPKTQQQQQPSPQRQPTQQPKQPVAAATTTKILPSGWEKKLDPRSGRYFFVDHNTGTTHWTPPALGPTAGGESRSTVVAKAAKPQDNSPKVSPQHAAVIPDSQAHKPSTASTSADSISTTKTRLKSASDAEFGSKPTLKRSFSSPNIAKMVMEEENRPAPVAKPTIDRTTKPSERLTNIQQQVRPVTISRMRNLAPVYGSMGRARTGLKNLGNTCFMNSVVQCLSATTLLSEYFINDHYLGHINRHNPLGRGGEVVEEFAVVIKALWSGQYRSISPRDLRDTVYKYVPEFRKHMGHHHDSQEFLLFLMDGLHEDINQVTKREYIEEPDYAKMADEQASRISWENHKRFNRSIIVELFQGQFKSTIRCLTCQHKSIKFDAFTFLTLPIPSSGRTQLKDCLDNFSKPEKMTGDNAIHCSRCKTKRNSMKTILLWKLPPVLLICLKRFYHEGMWRQKLQTMVEYPLQDMDMMPFTNGTRKRGLYNLFAVSNHTGTLDGGHYTAYCKNVISRRWYKYDDHEVYDVSSGNIKSSAAYILFYSSIDLPPP